MKCRHLVIRDHHRTWNCGHALQALDRQLLLSAEADEPGWSGVMIIAFNGYPGVGKRTIGRELADLGQPGARFPSAWSAPLTGSRCFARRSRDRTNEYPCPRPRCVRRDFGHTFRIFPDWRRALPSATIRMIWLPARSIRTRLSTAARSRTTMRPSRRPLICSSVRSKTMSAVKSAQLTSGSLLCRKSSSSGAEPRWSRGAGPF